MASISGWELERRERTPFGRIAKAVELLAGLALLYIIARGLITG